MLGPNLITAAAIPHFHTVLQASLPGPMHEELRQTIERAAQPPGGTLSLEGQGEIAGIFAFWVYESKVPDNRSPTNLPFHDGFQSGWLQSAREYCLQGGKPHHQAILKSLQDLDEEIAQLACTRDRVFSPSETRVEGEPQRDTEAHTDFLQKQRQARQQVINELSKSPHLLDLEAPSAQAKSGLSGIIHSLHGWECGLRLFHYVGQGFEGLTVVSNWHEALFKAQQIEDNELGGGNDFGSPHFDVLRMYHFQGMSDTQWPSIKDQTDLIANIGELRSKGLLTVADHGGSDFVSVTRLGHPLIKQSLTINETMYYVSQAVDEVTKLKITIRSTDPKKSTAKLLPETFTFRVSKPPQSLAQKKFWESISQFLNLSGSLTDKGWENATYDISAYLELLMADDHKLQEIWATLNGRNFVFLGKKWRITFTGHIFTPSEFAEVLGLPQKSVFEYAVGPEPQQGEENAPEFLIHETSLTMNQLETVEEIFRRMLPEILQIPVSDSTISFGGQGHILRVR